jgi:hypothetical protein
LFGSTHFSNCDVVVQCRRFEGDDFLGGIV